MNRKARRAQQRSAEFVLTIPHLKLDKALIQIDERRDTSDDELSMLMDTQCTHSD